MLSIVYTRILCQIDRETWLLLQFIGIVKWLLNESNPLVSLRESNQKSASFLALLGDR